MEPPHCLFRKAEDAVDPIFARNIRIVRLEIEICIRVSWNDRAAGVGKVRHEEAAHKIVRVAEAVAALPSRRQQKLSIFDAAGCKDIEACAHGECVSGENLDSECLDLGLGLTSTKMNCVGVEIDCDSWCTPELRCIG